MPGAWISPTRSPMPRPAGSPDRGGIDASWPRIVKGQSKARKKAGPRARLSRSSMELPRRQGRPRLSSAHAPSCSDCRPRRTDRRLPCRAARRRTDGHRRGGPWGGLRWPDHPHRHIGSGGPRSRQGRRSCWSAPWPSRRCRPPPGTTSPRPPTCWPRCGAPSKTPRRSGSWSARRPTTSTSPVCLLSRPSKEHGPKTSRTSGSMG